jgi:hypothetical protein
MVSTDNTLYFWFYMCVCVITSVRSNLVSINFASRRFLWVILVCTADLQRSCIVLSVSFIYAATLLQNSISCCHITPESYLILLAYCVHITPLETLLQVSVWVFSAYVIC